MSAIPDSRSWSADRAKDERWELEMKVQSMMGPIKNIRDLDIFTLKAMHRSLYGVDESPD